MHMNHNLLTSSPLVFPIIGSTPGNVLESTQLPIPDDVIGAVPRSEITEAKDMMLQNVFHAFGLLGTF